MRRSILLPPVLYFIAGAAAGLLLTARGPFFDKPEKVIIKEIEKPVTRYVRVVEYRDTSGLWNCYQSPIIIRYRMDENTLHVRASDTCKTTTQDVRLKVSDDGRWKMYVGIGIGAAAVGGGAIYLMTR